MKKGIILSSLFVIIMFAAGANAQHVKTFDGHGNGYLLAPSRSAELPTIDVLDGRPVKVTIDFLKTHRSTPAEISRIRSSVDSAIVPCGSADGGAARTSNDKFQVYLELQLENTLVSSYSISARRGTCRLLRVRLANGSEYYGKLRFR